MIAIMNINIPQALLLRTYFPISTYNRETGTADI